jgi:RNA polymerase sigma-70 factor (ECF subfamily)
METNPGQVTELLKAMGQGDEKAADALLPLVYAELHRLAKIYMRRERPDHTLQATALIVAAHSCDAYWSTTLARTMLNSEVAD